MRHQSHRACLILIVVAGLTACSAGKPSAQRTQAGFVAPDQLLVDKEVDKETEFAAVVRAKKVANRWVILPDGDHLVRWVGMVSCGRTTTHSRFRGPGNGIRSERRRSFQSHQLVVDAWRRFSDERCRER